MKTIKLFGVAGAGKTTKCLDLIKNFVKQGYSIHEIAFTTYTTAGIESIKQKLEEDNVFLPEENNFRTLHSLCWRLSDFQSPMNWKKFAQQNNIEYDMDEFSKEKTLGKYIEGAYEDIQNKKSINVSTMSTTRIEEELIDLYSDDEFMTKAMREDIVQGLKWCIEWKMAKNQHAYSDAFIKVLEEEIDIQNKILIVDEAQDLFQTQIKLIELWTQKYTKDIFVLAGDDDQCVHEWAGSKPDFLIETKADEEIILEKSYRCPEKISVFANKILSKIKYRREKKIWSEKKGGEINLLKQPRMDEIISQIDEKENTFLLFRTNKILTNFSEVLFESTKVPFSYLGNKQSPYSLKFVNIHNAIIKLHKKQPITFDEACYLIMVLETDQLHKGIKSNFKKQKENENKLFSFEYFITKIVKWGLKRYDPNFDVKIYLLQNIKYDRIVGENQDKKIKRNEFINNKISDSEDLIYFKKYLDKRGRGHAKLPVILGTFHASKGLEAENVMVFLGTSPYFNQINDTEYRCLYVASTRTRNKLTFIDSCGFNEDYSLYDAFELIYNS